MLTEVPIVNKEEFEKFSTEFSENFHELIQNFIGKWSENKNFHPHMTISLTMTQAKLMACELNLEYYRTLGLLTSLLTKALPEMYEEVRALISENEKEETEK